MAGGLFSYYTCFITSAWNEKGKSVSCEGKKLWDFTSISGKENQILGYFQFLFVCAFLLIYEIRKYGVSIREMSSC